MDTFNTLFLWLVAGVVFWLALERGHLAERLRVLERELDALHERLSAGSPARLPVAPVAPAPQPAERSAPPPSPPPAAPAPAYTPLMREYAVPEMPVAPRESMIRPAVPAAGPASLATETPAPEPPAPQPRPEGERGPTLEERIGGHWLSWAGAVTLVITLVIGLQWAIAAGYVTWVFHLPPIAYLVAGWLAGGALLGASEWLRTRLPLYAQGLAGAGIAALYSTTYAGDALYHVLPTSGATFGLATTGLLAIGMAIRHNSVVIGWIGVLASYVSPVLLDSNNPSPVPLLLYVTALNAAVLGISVLREWSLFRLAAFLASALLYGSWHSAHYTPFYLPEALLFTAANFALFLGVLVLYPLVWRKPTHDQDLALAVLNPLLTGWLLHTLLQPRHADSMGLVAGALAAVYWLLARALRARRREEDYLEQLFHATSLVFALLAVPLQFKGRAMTPAWAFMGAALSVVGYRGASNRTRWWGAAALGLSVLRLLSWDAPYTPGPGPVIFFNLRGFAFGSVLLSLAVVAGTWADQYRREGRREGVALAWLTGLTLLIGGLMQYWIRLDVPAAGVAVGWSAVAGLGLAYGWRLRSREIRTVGMLLTMSAVIYALRYAGEERQWVLHAPGLLATALLCAGAACTYERRQESMAESGVLVPGYAGVGVVALLWWSWLDIGRDWLSVSWLAISAGLLWSGFVSRRVSLRALGGMVALPAVWYALQYAGVEREWVRHAPGLLSAVLLCFGTAWAYARQGERLEEGGTLVPLCVGTGTLPLLWWSWLDLGLGWLTAAWVGISLLLLWAGMASRRVSLRILGAGVALLATAELFARELTLPSAHVLLLHHRSAALLVGVLAWTVYGWCMHRSSNEAEARATPLVVVLANVLGLLWLSLEAMDGTSRFAPAQWSAHAAQFGLSAAWIVYAAVSIAAGFRWSQPGARWGGMALLGATVVKVYMFDLGQLALGYRLVSFLCLAAILLGVSYAYQRRERASRIS